MRSPPSRLDRTPPATDDAACLLQWPAMEANELRELGQQFRVDSIRPAAVAKSGHPTSSHVGGRPHGRPPRAATCATTSTIRRTPRNDHLIFSKGHASPLCLRALQGGRRDHRRGAADVPQVREPARGPPDAVLPWVDVATGSLGQGLPIGVGVALAGEVLDRLPYRVWVLCGDSEMAEGSMWEAFEHAGHDELDNLIGDPRHQPARPARRDDARLEHRRLRRARRARSAGTRSRSTATTSPRSTGRTRRRARTRRASDADRRAHDEGQGRRRGREQGRLARQAARRSRGGDRGARRRSRNIHVDDAEARAPASSTASPAPAARAAALRAGRRGRDAQGVRRGARRARRSARRMSSRSTAR